MRLAVVLLLVVVLVLIPDSDAWGRRRRRRRWFRIRIRIPKIIRTISTIRTIIGVAGAVGKREVTSFDLNNDGHIDQEEAEKIFEKRDAENVLSFADEDGDSTVSVAEFEQALQKMTERDVDYSDMLEEDLED